MTLDAASLARPQLTLPPAEAAWLRDAYEGAGTILEYGSGGSTVMAAEMDGKTVWSVESDRTWAEMMRVWFAANPPRSQVRVHDVDIGPTRDWGFPARKSAYARFPYYPLGVWDVPGFAHPDVVLIDGRFRVGCFLATLFRISRPVSVYFDDYAPRKSYRVVESFAEVAERRGRMARFELEPRQLAPEELLAVVEAMIRPN